MAYDKTPQSRNEEILLSIINKTEYNKTPQSREEELLLALKDMIEHGGDSQHHYSTDEQVVGTWIDGSVIYEKTFSFTMPKSDSWQSYNHGIEDIDKVVDVNALFNADGIVYSLPQYRDGSHAIIIGVEDTTVEFINTWLNDGNVTCTLKYTKTTN